MSREVEPMDIDIVSEFDNKENAINHSNVRTPCTEKGYEELDVSELNMKLRYSITPASSPMSKSFTANSLDNRSYDCDVTMNASLTSSFNSTITKNESIVKNKTLPLQEQFTSVLRPLESTLTAENVPIVMIDQHDDENVSIPSTSSSAAHTPEATTPTKEIPRNAGGSPIMRGLKSVFNIFRSSQSHSPIPPNDEIPQSIEEKVVSENEPESQKILASTPVSTKTNSRRNSPQKESIIFNDDLEKELQWKDETDVIFKHEKLPVQKLFFPYIKALNDAKSSTEQTVDKCNEKFENSVEHMEISYNEAKLNDSVQQNVPADNIDAHTVESDCEFLDCETMGSKHESQLEFNEIKHEINKSENVITVTNNEITEKAICNEINTTVAFDITKETLDATMSIKSGDLTTDSKELIELIDSCIENQKTVAPENHLNNTGELCNIVKADYKDNILELSKHDSINSDMNMDCVSKEVIQELTKDNNCDISLLANYILDNTTDLYQENIQDDSITKEKENIEILTMNADWISEKVNQIKENIYRTSIHRDKDHLNKTVDLKDMDTDTQNEKEITAGQSNILQSSIHDIEQVNNTTECVDGSIIQSKVNNGSIIQSENNLNKTVELNLEQTENESLKLAITPESYIEDASTPNFLQVTGENNILNQTNEISSNIREFKDKYLNNAMELTELQNEAQNESLQSASHVITNTEYTNKINISEISTTHTIENTGSGNIESIDTSNAEQLNLQSSEHIVPLQVDVTVTSDNFEPVAEQNLTEIKDESLANISLENNCIPDLIPQNELTCLSPVDVPLPEDDNIELPTIPENQSYVDLDINNKTQTYTEPTAHVPLNIEPVCQDQVTVIDTNESILHKVEVPNEIHTSNEPNSSQVIIANDTNYIITSDNNNAEEINKDIDITIVKDVEEGNESKKEFVENKIGLNELKIVSVEPSQDEVSEQSALDKIKNDIQTVLENVEQNTISVSLVKEQAVLNNTIEVEVNLDMKNIECLKSDVVEDNVQEHEAVALSSHDIELLPKEPKDALSVYYNNIKIPVEEVRDIDCESSNVNIVCEIPTTENISLRNDRNEDVIENMEEDIIVSENSSPFVSVTGEIKSIPTSELIEGRESLIGRQIPGSPPIVSKGYNFNFDNIEDPFATKTKIRLSPTPMDTVEFVDSHEKEHRNDFKNRRKSQPARRPNHNKKAFNKTFSNFKSDTPIKTELNSNATKASKCNEMTTEENERINLVPMQIVKPIDVGIVTQEGFTEEVPIDDSVDEESNETIVEIEDHPDNNTVVAKELKNGTSSESLHKLDDNISSSEQSVYVSAGTSSNETMSSRNVFNLPEIDDMNFNPFMTKIKIRQSPTPDNINNTFEFVTDNKNNSFALDIKPDTISQIHDENTKIDITDTDTKNNEIMTNLSNTTNSSKTTDEKDNTVREVNTEDEDTEEGPFLDNEDFSTMDKLNFESNKDDFMNFADLPEQSGSDNIETGEIFIDAEAYEFLLNQNVHNDVSDHGKESLFLKFDPLFAKRVSTDGIASALKHIQSKQSTPKKVAKTPETAQEPSPRAGPSNRGIIHENVNNTMDISYEDLNVTVSKPMMVVNPAVNPVVVPRNKSITPTRSNRRSYTFTSPAMAAIDRLLSLSGNNSFLGHDTTVTHVNREQQEAELALTQLRELLSEKEINVHHLRTENKELKDRLSNLETQLKTLETESEQRLKKVNDLNEALTEKTKMNRSMAVVVEEYERTIASLIQETEQDRNRHAEERSNLIKERDEQSAHLSNLEVSFGDLHNKYEKSKQVILNFKANEDAYKKSVKDFEDNLSKMQSNYEQLKQHATSKLNHANQELEKMNKAHEAEVLKMNAMIKRKELHITSLEETLAQKTKANQELTAICDELINKVG